MAGLTAEGGDLLGWAVVELDGRPVLRTLRTGAPMADTAPAGHVGHAPPESAPPRVVYTGDPGDDVDRTRALQLAGQSAGCRRRA